MLWLLGAVCSLCLLVTNGQEVKTEDEKANNDKNKVLEFFNNCTCVFYYQCDELGFVITSGKGLIEERIGEQGDNANSENKSTITCHGGAFQGEQVCCKYKISTTTPTSRNSNGTTTPIDVISTTQEIITRKRKIQCGKTRFASINVKISTGEDDLAPLDGEFPWLAAIYRKKGTQWNYHKVGSLIHPRVILTAAHVISRSKADEFKVIVNGQIRLSQIGDNETQERDVEEIVKHSEFSSGSLINNIALMILQKPYDLTSSLFINTLCLQPEISFENKRCFVAGWGQTSIQGEASKILKKVDLPTHLPAQCQQMLRRTRLGVGYIFHESFMCAGGEEGKSSCTGDGGGPLMCPTGENDAMYQVGIVSYGVGCGMKDVPDVYANVPYFHDWIVEQLKNRNINFE